jgi:hypothetical protein
VLQFIERNAVDRGKLQEIIQKHGLDARWKEFERKYLEIADG